MKALSAQWVAHVTPGTLLTGLMYVKEGISAVQECQAYALEVSEWWFNTWHPDPLGQMEFKPHSSISAKGSSP